MRLSRQRWDHLFGNKCRCQSQRRQYIEDGEDRQMHQRRCPTPPPSPMTVAKSHYSWLRKVLDHFVGDDLIVVEEWQGRKRIAMITQPIGFSFSFLFFCSFGVTTITARLTHWSRKEWIKELIDQRKRQANIIYESIISGRI